MGRYKLAFPVDMGKLLANKALLDADFNLWVKELILSGYKPILDLQPSSNSGTSSYMFLVIYPDRKRDTFQLTHNFIAMGTNKEFYEVWWNIGPGTVDGMLNKSIKTKDLGLAMHVTGEVLRNGDYEPPTARDESST
jgi:hypothetical protein